MFKNKMLQWLIMILIAITLIALASFILWDYLNREAPAGSLSEQVAGSVEGIRPKKMSASEMAANTVEIRDITTNLAGRDYIKIGLAFLLENSKAKGEFQLLEPQVRAIVLQTLADLTAEQASGSKGLDLISTTLINKINPILSKGKLTQVDITDINIVHN